MQIELVLESSYLALENVTRQAEKSNKLLCHNREVDLNPEKMVRLRKLRDR